MRNQAKQLMSASLASTLLATAPCAFAEQWEFSIAPLYLWAKNIEGAATAGGNELPLDLDFKDDILDNLDAAFAIHVEATNGTLTLFAEYNYANLDPTVENTIGPITVEGDVTFKDTMSEGGIAWVFAETGATRWEVLGGLRYFKQDVKIDFSSNVPVDLPFPTRLEVGDSWMQPFAGIRTSSVITDRWSFRARGEYGYEGSDNTSFQVIGMFDYRYRDWGSAFFGYRYLDIDYDNRSSGLDQYGFDGDQQGPLIGLNFYF